MILALPTARGWVFSFAAVSSLGVALVNAGLATALCAAALCGTVLASFLLAQFSLYFLELRREAGSDGTIHQPLLLPVTIRNRSILFRQSTVLREKARFAENMVIHTPVPPLAPREKLTLQRRVTPRLRGHFAFAKVKLYGGDPAGLFRRSRTFMLPGEVMIRPAVTLLPGIPLTQGRKPQPSPEGRPLGLSGSGQEFFGVRPYRPGDEMRFIHWKGTAAKGKLMVKEFEANTIDRITILLDNNDADIGRDPHENNFELLIAMAASLSDSLKEMYCQLSFFCFDDEGMPRLLNGDAAGLQQRVFDILTELRPGKHPFEMLLEDTLELIAPGSVVYALTMSQSPRMGELFGMLSEYDIDVRWIYAPKENFPFIDPETPRTIYPGKIKLPEAGPVRPRLAAFNTNIAEILKN